MQYDVMGVFLNAIIILENPVICDILDGFKKDGICVRLNRALYGLRDSLLLWYEEFSSSLKEVGLRLLKEEPCLFFSNDRKILVLFYVDDILLLYQKKDEHTAKKMWDQIMLKYEIQE
jgi:hypothetical protein